mmetsp:Transcript_71054/g.139604  ORF Transcript_71054/g.139604 Transcript_71054/m.139604 type:complete len:233 (+) Transcript_71054:327-1025(+)
MRLDAVVLGGVFGLEVAVEVHVVPQVVLHRAVVVEARALHQLPRRLVVVGAREPAHEALVGERVRALVLLVAQSSKRVHDQTGQNVEQQDAHPHEERQLEDDPGKEVVALAVEGVHEVAQGVCGDAFVQDEPEARNHRVATPAVLVVVGAEAEVVFEVLQAELRVNHHRAHNRVKHDAQLVGWHGDRLDDVPQDAGVVYDVHEHEREERAGLKPGHGGGHQSHVVSEERFRH